MAGDMYLENLEEFIFDEDRVVTYRWLSQTLSVHVNQAKQMLQTFLEHQQNKANSRAISVTYLLSGIQETDNGVKVNKVVIVSEEDLEKTKAAMTRVLSKHVYSIHKATLKDSNSLYMADYQIIKDNIRQPNRFSAIKCVEAKPRTPEELAELLARSDYPTSATNTPPKPKMNGSADKHVIESLKPVPQKGPASKVKKGQITAFGGFAATSSKGPSERPGVKEEAEPSRQKQEEPKQAQPSSKAKAGMMAFLNRPSTAKPKKEERSSPPRDPATSRRAQEAVKTSNVPKKPMEMNKGPKSAGKAKRKAAKIDVSDSDSDEERQTAKRRRRIIQQDDSSSSSSEDELSDMEDSPIPPTPPPAPVDASMSDDEEEEEVTKGSAHTPSAADEKPSSTPGSGKRRRRKRVLRNKTTIDDEGCMVTEKVWESDWTDVSEDEAPPSEKTTPQSTAPPHPSPKETVGEEEGKKKKTSPGSGSGKAKQRSLMSFFKKK